MTQHGSDLKSDWGTRFFWGLTFKNRKILIPILIGVVIIGTVVLIQRYISMDMQVKRLLRYEPIYVLGLASDLNIGDQVQESDLRAFLFYKDEFNKISANESGTNIPSPSMISCNFNSETGAISGYSDVVGRVLNTPVLKNSFLRREYFAPLGTVPGLTNLIEEDHTMLDVEVPQLGFNVFIKPNDFVDLYEADRKGSSLLASKVKVILVDSQALGKAPLQVAVNPKAKRHLTIAVPNTNFATVAKALEKEALRVTYQNGELPQEIKPRLFSQPQKKPQMNNFTALTMIQGDEREVLSK